MFVPVLDSNKIRIQRADGYAYHPMEATRDNKSPRALHSAEQLASLPGQGDSLAPTGQLSAVELTGLLTVLYQKPMPISHHVRLAARNLIRLLAAYS